MFQGARFQLVKLFARGKLSRLVVFASRYTNQQGHRNKNAQTSAHETRRMVAKPSGVASQNLVLQGLCFHSSLNLRRSGQWPAASPKGSSIARALRQSKWIHDGPSQSIARCSSQARSSPFRLYAIHLPERTGRTREAISRLESLAPYWKSLTQRFHCCASTRCLLCPPVGCA